MVKDAQCDVFIHPFCGLIDVGNFMYFAANSKYMIMGSRFIVGECVLSTASFVDCLTTLKN